MSTSWQFPNYLVFGKGSVMLAKLDQYQNYNKGMAVIAMVELIYETIYTNGSHLVTCYDVASFII